jgi:hypothetical protein
MPTHNKPFSPLESALAERREALNTQKLTPQSGRWGIALSGGGIRSAVFSYGLISALAKSDVLWRFDLLSTVSGGGYFGSALGKLANTKNAKELQEELCKPRSHSTFQQQMRASNRYLTPKGKIDIFYVAAIYIRNILAVHVELLLLCMLLSIATSAWDILVWFGWQFIQPLLSTFPALQDGLTLMIIFSPVMLIAIPIFLLAAWQCCLYWYAPSAHHARIAIQTNQQLYRYLIILSGVLLLALIDMTAQRLSGLNYWIVMLGGFYSGILLVLRVLMPLLHLKRDAASLLERKLFMVLDVAGLFGLMILAIFWMSLFHARVTHQLWHQGMVVYSCPILSLMVVALVVLFLTGIRMNNWPFLNRSSLHHFYRLRLGRAWLGFDKIKPSPAKPERRETDFNPDGDIRFSDYRPWRNGGPVHLLNVCLNESTSWRKAETGDRQGHLMSVLGGGYFTLDSSKYWSAISKANSLSLATWMAISGAATAPGMGMMTRPGLASLFTSLGVRLGFWWQADYAILSPWALKYRCLLSELLGSFSLQIGKPWFLSDGGHSENTATWALLKAHCELIILADAAADPDYGFNDLENLIRRARADLNVHIEFVKPDNNQDGMFGSLDELGDPQSIACLALARIYYPDGFSGVMILIKPNLTSGLPDDVFNYARDNPKFPQQSTVDQFYDEAQWESYFALGQRLGQPLTRKRLLALLTLEAWEMQPAACNLLSAQPTKPLPGRKPTRITRKAGAAASLGLATILTSASGLYAALQQVSDPISSFNMAQLYQRLGDLPLDVNGSMTAQSTNKMAAMLLMLEEQNGRSQLQRVRDKQPPLDQFIKDTYSACHQYPTVISCKRLNCSSIPEIFEREISPMMNAGEYWTKFKGR